MPPAPTIAWTSDRTLLLTLPTGDHAQAHVALLWRRLQRSHIPALLDLTPAFASIQLLFDPIPLARDRRLPNALEREVRRLATDPDADAIRDDDPPRTVEIPVCYEGEDLAPDLAHVAQIAGLPTADVVRLHADATYRAAFLGFVPGFAYLTGLPPLLHIPRLDSPRTRVAPGSVAIAGAQAGIYPSPTPGGWRILGRTPFRLFDPTRESPALLRAGDLVRFVPISRATFDAAARGEAS